NWSIIDRSIDRLTIGRIAGALLQVGCRRIARCGAFIDARIRPWRVRPLDPQPTPPAKTPGRNFFIDEPALGLHRLDRAHHASFQLPGLPLARRRRSCRSGLRVVAECALVLGAAYVRAVLNTLPIEEFAASNRIEDRTANVQIVGGRCSVNQRQLNPGDSLYTVTVHVDRWLSVRQRDAAKLVPGRAIRSRGEIGLGSHNFEVAQAFGG